MSMIIMIMIIVSQYEYDYDGSVESGEGPSSVSDYCKYQYVSMRYYITVNTNMLAWDTILL